MGFSYYLITLTKISAIEALQDFLFTNIMKVTFHTKNAQTRSHQQDQFQPSPSLVPLPIPVINKSIKDHLPIKVKSQLRGNDEEGHMDDSCAVCLNTIEEWDMVRELGNCKHKFHAHCLDSWMDEGKETCPICRAKLMPGHGEEMGKDPWRSQRMIYLFGEDFVMGED
ncbi:hypothetical protein CDL12_29118 [Handroanthus impetiginosus]|uniref:RING-type domain-containing protein n=1 Tax=Handroanthus impetiginosus TaxID=429701 RepID=A0A2G9FZT7_9LAMI|nr:hypothetical protein CDL12_29118 [Handroanthus impetiginosus]